MKFLEVDRVRDLGVILDRKLLLDKHIDSVVNRAYSTLGFIMRVCRPLKNIHSLRTVYVAYVRSLLEFASNIWSPQYATYKLRIERIQKRFIRHLNFRSFSSGLSYAEGLQRYGLETLEDRRVASDMSSFT